MAYSKTLICNMALSKIGEGKINSLDEETEQSRVLNINYDTCLETTLRAFPWNFAKKAEALALVTDETHPNFDYVYQYPSNAVEVLRVFEEGDTDKYRKTEFIVFTNSTEKLIATDLEDAYVEYTDNVIIPALYDSSFVNALVYCLAAEIANTLSNNANKANEMYQKFQLAIISAKQSNATEGNREFKLSNRYINARY